MYAAAPLLLLLVKALYGYLYIEALFSSLFYLVLTTKKRNQGTSTCQLGNSNSNKINEVKQQSSSVST